MDFAVSNHGSIVMIRVLNRKARKWVKTFVSPEGYQPNYPDELIVEPRYADAIIKGMIADGFHVR